MLQPCDLLLVKQIGTFIIELNNVKPNPSIHVSFLSFYSKFLSISIFFLFTNLKPPLNEVDTVPYSLSSAIIIPIDMD